MAQTEVVSEPRFVDDDKRDACGPFLSSPGMEQRSEVVVVVELVGGSGGGGGGGITMS